MIDELTFAQEAISKKVQEKDKEQLFQDYEDCESICELDCNDLNGYSDCNDFYYDAEQEN